MKKRIAILTVGRTDYSYFRPVLKEIERHKGLEYYLIAAGMHLEREFGLTYREIERDGFTIHRKLKAASFSNTAEGAAKAAACLAAESASVFADSRIDLLLVLGDRIETLAMTCSAIPYNIPVAHMCGGDVTEGAFDERVRHALTKIAHIHFPTNALSAKRILRMGEEPWRVLTAGSTSIDMMKRAVLYTKREFFKLYRLNEALEFILVTFHPATLETEETAEHADKLIRSLKHLKANIIITYPNSDPGFRTIIKKFDEFARGGRSVRFVKCMGIKGYYSAMKYADAMVGNSSSGIIESATFKLPVVDIGDRQKSRMAGKNVIHSTYDPRDITEKLDRALSLSFRNSLKILRNPYGNGDSSGKIVKFMEKTLYGKTKKEIIVKKFCDWKKR